MARRSSFEEAVRIRLVFPQAYVNLGNALRRLGRHEEAEGCYRRAVELMPGDRQASFGEPA